MKKPLFSKPENLEKKFLYRFIKVVYYFLLVIVLFSAVGVASEELPEEYVDDDSSEIICDSGKRYSLDEAGIFLWSPDDSLEEYEVEDVLFLCDNGVSKSGNFWFTPPEWRAPEGRNFTVETVIRTRGSWLSAIKVGVLILLGGYVALGFLRDVSHYLFFGVKLSWFWIKRPINLIKKLSTR